jgi:hypothetical protein
MSPHHALRSFAPVLATAVASLVLAGCGGESARAASTAAPTDRGTAAAGTDSAVAASMPVGEVAGAADRAPNELGRIPVLEYHLIVPQETNEFTRTPQRLRQDLEELRRRGYVPVNMTDVLDKKIQNLPKGASPVVLVFDDASASQFRYLERGGKLVIDPTSAVGILEDFSARHADWPRRAVFCMLPAAQAGRSFFGDKGIEGQKTEWRFQKVQFLHKQGYELCNHTLYHARLDKSGDRVQEFIARGDWPSTRPCPATGCAPSPCRSACGRRTVPSPGAAPGPIRRAARWCATATTRCSRSRATPTRARTTPSGTRTASTARSCSATRSSRRSTASTAPARAAAT